jgi:hypothetical protein
MSGSTLTIVLLLGTIPAVNALHAAIVPEREVYESRLAIMWKNGQRTPVHLTPQITLTCGDIKVITKNEFRWGIHKGEEVITDLDPKAQTTVILAGSNIVFTGKTQGKLHIARRNENGEDLAAVQDEKKVIWENKSGAFKKMITIEKSETAAARKRK